MREIVHFSKAEAQPAAGDVLEVQGLPEEDALAPRLRRLLDEAMAGYAALVEPQAVCQDLEPEAFAELLEPLAVPAGTALVGRLFPRAEALALYVATVGEALPRRIRRLFAEDALAEGYMLDSVASAGADLLAERLAERFETRLRADGRPHARVLPYSPGYCGWPTTGQRPLFAALRPHEIGVTLNESCLMMPLKSVSGVLLAALAEAHRFRPDFPFCRECQNRECGRRMASLKDES